MNIAAHIGKRDDHLPSPQLGVGSRLMAAVTRLRSLASILVEDRDLLEAVIVYGAIDAARIGSGEAVPALNPHSKGCNAFDVECQPCLMQRRTGE